MNVSNTVARIPSNPSDDAPYFAEGVLAKARANKNKYAAYNQASVDEPKALAKAIKKHYATNPLVLELRATLKELSVERKQDCVLCFGAPTNLVLTANGFGTTGADREYDYYAHETRLTARPLGDSLPVGDRGTCAGVRVKIDAALIKFVDGTESNVRTDISNAKLAPLPPKPSQEEEDLQQAAKPKKKRGFFRRIFKRH